jgi:hypothetical protein
MVAIPIEMVLLHPFVITLSMFTIFLFIFLFILMLRTPAMKFFKGGFGKKIMLINPDEDRRMMFRVASKDKTTAYIKGRGHYIIDPKHVFIEPSSKLPCAFVYGMFGESIGLDDADASERLAEMGLKNISDLYAFTYKSAEKMLKEGNITKEQYDTDPKKIYTIQKEIHICGKSVGFDEVFKYFARNTRADLIESTIQHRISALKTEMQGSKAQELFKWAIILAIVLIAGALAYNMIMMGKTPDTVTTQGVGGIIGSGVNAISGGAGIV